MCLNSFFTFKSSHLKNCAEKVYQQILAALWTIFILWAISRNRRLEMLFKIGIPKNSAIFTWNHLRWSFFLKMDSNKGVFLWILQNPSKPLFLPWLLVLLWTMTIINFNRPLENLGSIGRFQVTITTFLAEVEWCDALRKATVIAAFTKHFETTTFRKS